MTEYEKIRYADYKLAYAALISCYPFGLEDLDGEEWRVVVDCDDMYQVSNYGRVKSYYNHKIVILPPRVNSHGYLYYNLKINGKTKKLLAHRLVAMAFIPNPDNKPSVNHIDGCKMNNYVCNLEWCTNKENTRHAVKIGLIKCNEDCRYAKLTNEQVAYCRRVYIPRDPEFGAAALARKFKIGKSSMLRILNGQTYKNVE